MSETAMLAPASQTRGQVAGEVTGGGPAGHDGLKKWLRGRNGGQSPVASRSRRPPDMLGPYLVKFAYFLRRPNPCDP